MANAVGKAEYWYSLRENKRQCDTIHDLAMRHKEGRKQEVLRELSPAGGGSSSRKMNLGAEGQAAWSAASQNSSGGTKNLYVEPPPHLKPDPQLSQEMELLYDEILRYSLTVCKTN